jgi:hypothetical protein
MSCTLTYNSRSRRGYSRSSGWSWFYDSAGQFGVRSDDTDSQVLLAHSGWTGGHLRPSCDSPRQRAARQRRCVVADCDGDTVRMRRQRIAAITAALPGPATRAMSSPAVRGSLGGPIGRTLAQGRGVRPVLHRRNLSFEEIILGRSYAQI